MHSFSSKVFLNNSSALGLTNLCSELQQQKILNGQRLNEIESLQNQNQILQIQQSSIQHSSPFHNDLINSQIIFNSISPPISDTSSQQFSNIDCLPTIDQIGSSFRADLRSSLQKKLITALGNKSLMLQSLSDLRKQSYLFQSHKRVILKQYLEQLRVQNSLIQNQNQAFLLQSRELSTYIQRLQDIRKKFKLLNQSKSQVLPLSL